MSSYRVAPATHIHLCLSFIKFSLAISMAISVYVLIKIIPFGTSWISGTLSTLAGIWMTKSTIRALRSSKIKSLWEGSNGNDDLVCIDETDGLKLFESRQKNRMQSLSECQPGARRVKLEGAEKEEDQVTNFPMPSKKITATKEFLLEMIDEVNGFTSKVPFPLLALLTTVLIQCAVHLLVIIQNLRKSFPRVKSANSRFILFSDIPFAIGQNLSSSGYSFHIFSILNRLLESSGNDHSPGGNPDAHHIDNNMTLQALSFDRISINSSHFIIYPPRKYPTARDKLSWLGITFEDIDMSITVLLKRNGKRACNGNIKCMQTLKMQFKMSALEFGVFPCPLDWCKGTLFHIDANATSDSQSAPNPNLSGFGMSVTLSQIGMHRFDTCIVPSEEEKSKPHNRVFSWDKIDSSLYLHKRISPRNNNEEGHSKRATVSLVAVPSGFVVINASKAGNATMTTPYTLPLSRRARMNLGDFLCENRLTLGVDLKDMLAYVQSVDSLLRNLSSFMIQGASMGSDSYTMNKRVNENMPIVVAELNAVISMHLFTHINKDASSLDCFSFGFVHSMLHWENNAQSVFDVDSDQPTTVNPGWDDLSPLLMMDMRDASLRYEVLLGDQLDGSSTTMDVIHFKQVRTKIFMNNSHNVCANVDLGRIIARADGQVVDKLAKGLDATNLAACNLQHQAKETKQTISCCSKQNSSHGSSSEISKKKCEIEVSCHSVDVIIELFEGDISKSGKVRVALVHRETSVTILTKKGSVQEESVLSGDYSDSDLFSTEVQNYCEHYWIEAVVAHAEGSVIFSPHSSLPVIHDDDASHQNQEMSLYGRVAELIFKLAIPIDSSRKNSTRTPTLASKAISTTFNKLVIYELFGKRSEMRTSVLSIPVHEFSFCQDFSEIQHRDWPMAQTYVLCTSAYLVKIVQCTGSFCLVENRIDTTGERSQLISIRFTRGSEKVEIVWSPIFQWFQVSCNKRIQRVLDRIRRLASHKTSKKICVSSHKISIQIEVGLHVTANVYAFVGVKSMVHTVIEGRSFMNISMAKYLRSSNATLKQLTKPVFFFQARHMKVLLNDITSPIFTFEGLSVQNFLRRANDDEINEYISKKENPINAHCNDLVMDRDGHPLKEIFELTFGNYASAKLPPIFHFGEVIDDIILLPKALAFGFDRMKEAQNKPVKKYQLMLIKCTIPFLDVSLMGSDPDKHSTQAYSTSCKSQVLRFCFEDAKVSIERNAPPEWTQSQINALDEDDSTTHSYGPDIHGGLISLTVKHVVSILHPLNLATPLLTISDFAINGYLYLAGVSPTTLGIHEGKTTTSMLLCHHCHLTSNNVFAHRRRQCGCCYVVSVRSAGIPIKLYTDVKVTCGGLEISYGHAMIESIPRLMACIKRLLPPPPISSSRVPVPLPWWDNVRFFIHGSIFISMDELLFRWLLDSHINRDQSIIFNCCDCVISHTVGSFETDMSDIQVSVPGIAYDMSVHPSKTGTKPPFHFPHEAESVVGQKRHPLIYVPSFKMKITFLWKMFQPGAISSQHHSVYMECKTEPSSKSDENLSDKFAQFRSDGVNTGFDIELRGSDTCDNWVALRMDVLPWLTHLNSTVTYSTRADENQPAPIPKFQSVAITASASNLRVGTWFEDKQDMDGLCLIVRRVNYNATIDGSKDIVIEGPLRATLLNVSEFKYTENLVVDHHKSNDIASIEQMAWEFGMAQNWDNSEVIGCSSQPESHPCREEEPTLKIPPFLKLQHLLCDIDELDFVVVTGQIDIRNQSLAKILAGCELDCATANRKESQSFAGVDRTTWSILISRLKLLWTIEIRDSLMATSKDLIYTIGFMKSQNRQLQVLSGTFQQDSNVRGSRDTDEGIEISLHDSPIHKSVMNNASMLDFLLSDSFDIDLTSVEKANQDHILPAHPDEKKEASALPTLPTLDVHFSNPQVQLHSTATGGSIILAAEGAHVEGRKFIHFLAINAPSKSGKVSPSDLLRKTKHVYSLTNMEAYSLSTHVDINDGLPWLNVCSPNLSSGHQSVVPDEKKRNQHFNNDHHGSNSSQKYIYPSYLCHHEPLAFSKSGILRPILDTFTFQTRQLFHRPPIHYSTEELINFMKQGLVVCQEEAAIDDIKLQMDLLNFKLDSHQFKTTLDVIRNVLLEPPKPHQRHQALDSNSYHRSSGRISSVAAIEMEEILRNDNKGKKGRQTLHKVAISLLRDLEDRIALEGSEMFRRVSYTLSKLQWRIQSQDGIDDVQIAFTGFNGQHDYSRDGSIVSQFSLEDVRVSSLTPGPDSISFSDPTSIVKSVLCNERSPCQRCGQYFDHSKNNLSSCEFHLGKFKFGAWTCCNSPDAAAPGCKLGPHTGKELAAVVRVESLPHILEGISLYSHIEVNLFPGILHTLVVQISKSMSRLFMSYFFLGDAEKDYVDTMSTFSDVMGTPESSFMYSDSLKPVIGKKTLLIGGKGLPSKVNQESHEYSHFDNPSTLKRPDEETKEPEIAFIKVWRVGHVDVNVSLGGFKRLPLNSLGISVPAYSKAYEIGTWEYHGRKYLGYLVREVLKSGASSGIDKFRRKLMGSSVGTSGQNSHQAEPRSLERSLHNCSVPPMPPMSNSGPIDMDSLIGRHLRRPMGAADILGTPSRKCLKKKKKIFNPR